MQPLKKLISGSLLSTPETMKLFQELSSLNLAQQGAIFALLAARGETIEELLGALNFLLSQAHPFRSEDNIVEIVGTGGDALKTFNISTAANLIVAACGVKVVKHGGRAVSSLSGSTDVIEALQIPVYEKMEQIYQSLEKNSFVYLWAPLFNPLLQSFAALRKLLGVPTLLNILGPLTNPMRPQRQVIGVFREDLVEKIAEVLRQQGTHHALVVRSFEGLDELSLSAPTKIAQIKNGIISTFTLTPEEVGLTRAPIEAVQGGAPGQNAKIIENIFANKETKAKRDIVLLNAAAGLIVAGKVATFPEGIAVAKEAIVSNKALRLLEQIKKEKS